VNKRNGETSALLVTVCGLLVSSVWSGARGQTTVTSDPSGPLNVIVPDRTAPPALSAGGSSQSFRARADPSSATLTVTHSSLQPFVHQTGTSNTLPAQQTVEVSTPQGFVPFTDYITQTQGGAWLLPNVSGSTAGSIPAPINLNINPSGLPASPGT
jgi:hypothetical protein